MQHLAARLTLCSILFLAAGCSSPPSRFYTLSAVATAPAAAPSSLSVLVGPVSIPAAMDRPEIVVAKGPNQVQLEEQDRWASPLADEISRAVAENLVKLLGTPHVTQASQGLGTDAEYRATIEVQRFDSAPGESAALDAAWSVRRAKDGKARSGRTTVREPVAQQGYDALAAAHSRAIARLSQDLADAVRALAGLGRGAG